MNTAAPASRPFAKFLSRFLADYGMLFVLLLLCGYLTAATWGEQQPTGTAAGADLAERLAAQHGAGAQVLIVVRSSREESEFAAALRAGLTARACNVVAVVQGEPQDGRAALEQLAAKNGRLDVIACSFYIAQWTIYDRVPALKDVPRAFPPSYQWSTFLQTRNLLNICGQIAVIAIVGVGMTLVIITGGIDLSVGSLIGLAAVVSALLIQAAGRSAAGPLAMVGACLGGIGVCAAIGLLSGLLITTFRIPSFIMTLAMMLVAKGLASRFARGESIADVPSSFGWLGLEADFLNLPNSAVLMAALYLGAHVLMTRMTLGRYIYAVGGNAEAARLSGVPVRAVLLFVYTLCGALAGLGGVVMASQFRGGKADYGQMYELYVIAAVVVGGTSLQGGQGKILGTLIGAFIIAVSRNGMNLMGIGEWDQWVFFGLIILGAVLLDSLKHRGWRLWPLAG